MLRFFIYLIVFYLLYWVAKIFFRVFTSSSRQSNTRSNVNEPRKKRTKVNKKDIIDAEFEEIKDQEKDNSQN